MTAFVVTIAPMDGPRLSVRELEQLARTFDSISDEAGGARYAAAAFVTYVRTELAAARSGSPVAIDHMRAGARRRHDREAAAAISGR